jgi:hypothetical protein
MSNGWTILAGGVGGVAVMAPHHHLASIWTRQAPLATHGLRSPASLRPGQARPRRPLRPIGPGIRPDDPAAGASAGADHPRAEARHGHVIGPAVDGTPAQLRQPIPLARMAVVLCREAARYQD